MHGTSLTRREGREDAKREAARFFENVDLLEKYPNYVFSYEGAIHYMWFKEPRAALTGPLYAKDLPNRQGAKAGAWVRHIVSDAPGPLNHTLGQRTIPWVSEPPYGPLTHTMVR